MGRGKTLGRSGQQQGYRTSERWKGVGGLPAPAPAPAHSPAHSRARARVEELESRRLLDGGPDTVGREFWVAFEENPVVYTPHVQSLFFSSGQQARITVEIPGTGWRRDCSVNPGEVTAVEVPENAYASSDDGIAEVGIHVTSDQEIAVYGLNRQPYSTDGFTALPLDQLGTTYIAIAHTPDIKDGSPRSASQFAVVATEDGTNVTITPSVHAGIHLAGVPYVVALSRGEVYQLQDEGYGANFDLTGSWIEADRPVAVFSGDTTDFVPSNPASEYGGYRAGDHLVEQLVPISNWGDHFVTVPLARRVNGDTFRVLAADDGTEVRIGGVLRATLAGGQFYEWVSTAAQEVITSKPVTLAQFANGCEFDGGDVTKVAGDPFMAIIPPVELSMRDYTISTTMPAIGLNDYKAHFINVWCAAGTTVTLDGAAISTSAFAPIGNSGYVLATTQVNAGTHTVSGNAPVGMMLYGWADFESYAFVGGQSFGPSVPISDLVLEPATADRVVGQTHQVTALALDDAGQPVADVWVHFRVAGANPTSGITTVNAFTGADGRAAFSYEGETWGDDTVAARTTGVSRAATVKWHSVPVAASERITVKHDTLYTGAVDATTADGHSLIYSASTPPEHGTLVFQADGRFTYMPDAGYSGPDLFRFWTTEGPAISNVGTMDINVLPSNRPPVIGDQSFSVPEHCPMGTPVGVVQADDPDDNAIHFAIVDGDPSRVFTINAATGLIVVAKPEYLDYETMPRRYNLRVEVSDDGNPSLSNQATMTINITDIDESKIGFDLSSTSIPEHRPAGTVVGELLSSDPAAQSSVVYTLVPGPGSNDNATFAIVDKKLVATVSFDYEVRNSYRVRIRGTDGMTVFLEKAFAINVANINEAPAAIELSSLSVPEDQVIGTVVGYLSASSAIPDDVFTFSLVDGDGSESNRCFRIDGNRLLTAATFSYSSGLKYGIRVGVTNSYSLSVARSFVIGVVPLSEFGKVENKSKSLTIREADGDMVTFKLSGGGLGALNGSQVSLTGTTAKSVLSISVKKNKSGGDGLYTLTGLAVDGLLRGISGSAVVLSGPVRVNTLNQAAGAGKAAVSMKLKQISDAEICVQSMAVSSIAVGGWVSESRIVTTGSIAKFSAAAMAHSALLVGVSTSFGGQCAGHDDFTNLEAKLGKLTITGLKLPKGSSSPAFVVNSNISAPSVGNVSLVNVWDGGEPVVHVLNDEGVLKVAVTPLPEVIMFAGGTWSKAGERPAMWEVV